MRYVRAASALGGCLLSAPASAQDLLVIGAIRPHIPLERVEDVGDLVADTGEFARVDVFDGRAGTPTVAQMEDYHGVLVYSDFRFDDRQPSFADPVLLGDRLAAIVESGHGVVLLDGAIMVGSAVEGSIVTQGYVPVTAGIRTDSPVGLFVVQAIGHEWLQGPISGHPAVYGVNFLLGSDLPPPLGLGVPGAWSATRRAEGISVRPGSEVVATWSDGVPAIVIREPSEPGMGRTAAVNLFHLPGADLGWFGDGDRAIVSPILWTMNVGKPLDALQNTTLFQDLDCDGFDVSAELEVDLTDPLCAARVDPETGQPFREDDWYYDYLSNGCGQWLGLDDIDPGLQTLPGGPVLLTAAVAGDADPDGLVAFAGPNVTVTDPVTGQTRPVGQPTILSPDGIVASTATLECDNCPFDYNPDQYDIDWDEVGDLCDNCLYVPNGDQNNLCPATGFPDGDNIGVACDNCPCADNAMQKDRDLDDVGDDCDNCDAAFNADQADGDRDGLGDSCDSCPAVANPDQSDVDFDGVGDLCDSCPTAPNLDQLDRDGDGKGDACDVCPDGDVSSEADADGDGVGDLCDDCPGVADPAQADVDRDGVGDACDVCPTFTDPGQADADGDGRGDACDGCAAIAEAGADGDGDGVGDACDGCPALADADAPDRDGDGVSDACDRCPLAPSPGNADRDGDLVGDACDSCPDDADGTQADADRDGIGDACDDFEIRGGGRVGGGCDQAGGGWAPLGLLVLAAWRLTAAGRRPRPRRR